MCIWMGMTLLGRCGRYDTISEGLPQKYRSVSDILTISSFFVNENFSGWRN